MPFCEICGSESSKVVKRKIEGAVLNVCINCKDMGDPLPSERRKRIMQRNKNPYQAPTQNTSAPVYKNRSSGGRSNTPYRPRKKRASMKVVDNYDKILIKLRSKLGLSRDEFADSLKVQRTYYTRIEKKATSMPIKLAERITKKYKVDLTEKEEVMDGEEIKDFLKKDGKTPSSMVYFRKRGEKPDYDQT